MTGNKDIFSSLDSTCSFSVTLPDSSTSDQGIRIDNGTSFLSSSYVLYVASFPRSRITTVLNYSATFYLTFCEFQELGTKKMISTGHDKDGLYYLNLVSKLVVYSSLVSLVDYHCR